MYFFKAKLKRGDVNGNVKSNFRAHEDLLLMVGQQMVIEQALELFDLDACDSQPSISQIPHDTSTLDHETKVKLADEILGKFVNHYGYGKFSMNAPEVENVVDTEILVAQSSSGDLSFSTNKVTKPPDYIYNYSMQLCHWAVHLMSMNDTAKEGDVTRLLLNCSYNLPFFYSHSRLSKYFVENLDFLLKVKYLLSPQMSIRVLAGAFQNTKGGKGQCIETDLAMEHSIRNRKDLVRQLGANQSEKAILRISNAADTVNTICNSFDHALGVPTPSSRHSKESADCDRLLVRSSLRELRPFRKESGRKHIAYPAISQSPFHKINRQIMYTDMLNIIQRLCRGQNIEVEE